MIHDRVQAGQWRSITLSQGGTPSSHILCADDLVLFGIASMQQAELISKVLEDFNAAFGGF